MSNSTAYKKVIEEYNDKKNKSMYILETRKKEIYKKIPEIEKIHKELYEIGFKITKSILVKDEDRSTFLQNLRDTCFLLQEKEKYCLRENGYDENYLSNVYECTKCNDTGFIDNKKCSCFNQRLISKYYEMSNVENVIKIENFDNFDLRYYSDEKVNGALSPRENMKNIYNKAMQFTQYFPQKFRNLLLYGDTGLGKTFLCNCISKEILDKGNTVLYVTAPDIFKTLEDYRFNRSSMDKPEEYISLLTTVDLLIIDDLGTEVSTVVTSSELFNMVNTRFIKQKSTIISTNLMPSELEGMYSHRIESRFMGNYELIKFTGEDIRVLKMYGSKKQN